MYCVVFGVGEAVPSAVYRADFGICAVQMFNAADVFSLLISLYVTYLTFMHPYT